MPQWSGEAVSPQPERRLGAADGIINESEEGSEEDAACLLCGLRRETQFVHYKHSAAQIASQAFECVLEVNAGLAETNLKSNQVLIRNRKNWCKSRKADNVPVQALKHTHTSLLYKELKVEDTCFSPGDE